METFSEIALIYFTGDILGQYTANVKIKEARRGYNVSTQM